MVDRYRLGVVGVGNTLAGDDGAGVVAMRRLRERLGAPGDILFLELAGDPFALADELHRADRWLFLDAVAGDVPGRVARLDQPHRRGFAASLHQADVVTVMAALERLRVADPFPAWELWGVTIKTPEELGEELSPEVDAAVHELVGALVPRIREES